jgi:predicted GNAT family acetyltransferase
LQVRVDRYADAGDFLGAAESWLSADEVANNVMLSIARSLADGARALKERPYFAAATERGEIDCCAIQTPPHRILLTEGTPRGCAALAADAFEARGRVPGVIGPSAATAAFAEEWLRLASGQARISMRQRLHKLERVNADLPHVPGALREAEQGDRALAVEWLSAFGREALPGEPGEAEQGVDRHLKARSLYFWDSGGPVSMCARAGVAGNVARINAVYTPPDLRGRGYATAAVAALTRRLLSGGCRYCCLYTDLANPISNDVYHRIGYRPVYDLDQYTFS